VGGRVPLAFELILAKVEEFVQSEIAVFPVKVEMDVLDVLHSKHIHQLVIRQFRRPFATVLVHQIDSNLLFISPVVQPRKVLPRRLNLTPVSPILKRDKHKVNRK
jgi:hypothetical protein